jgi:hypothetical protein
MVEGAIPVVGAELQLLPPTDKNQLASRRKGERENNREKKKVTS